MYFFNNYTTHILEIDCSSLIDGLEKVQKFIDKLVVNNLIVINLKLNFDGTSLGYSKIKLKVWTKTK